MDQNLAIECIEVVENLSQKEKNKILSVLKRDDKLRIGQEHKISQLKQEINTIRKSGILRGGDDQSKMCIRCRAPLGFFFNRGDICPTCRFKVCSLCQEVMFNKSWLCKLCYKQRQLKWLTGEWAAFEQNPLRKWASGSDIYGASSSLQVFSGATSIDIGEPDSSRTNNNRSSKSSHNGMLSGSGDHDKQRVEYPKEADQHKLSQLFGVLRSRKPEETKELQVRRVSTRKYSETDSDSSSSSDVEAPSVTESELDKTESPRNVESPKSRLEAVDEDINETVESDRQNKTKGAQREKANQKTKDIQQEYVVIDKQVAERVVRPKVAQVSERSKGHRTEVESNEMKPKHREKKKLVPDQNLAREMRIKAEESTKVSQSKSVDISLNEPSNAGLSNSRKVASHSELSAKRHGKPNASKSHESLSRIAESQGDKRHARKSNENLPKEGRDVKRVTRNSAENLSPQVRSSATQNVRRSHENLGVDKDRDAANQNIRQARSHEHLPTSNNEVIEEQIVPVKRSREKLDSNVIQKTGQTPVIDIEEVTHTTARDHLLEKEVSSDTGIEGDIDTPRGQRSGSPYSFSMDSLPSSNPSPTLRRSIDSSLPGSSDTDSLSKFSHHEEFSGTESQIKEGSEDDFVVEEISKVRFQRVSKKAGQMSVLGKMASSPQRPGTNEDMVYRDRGPWKPRGRGGSGGEKYQNESVDEIFQPKSVALESKSPYSDNESEQVFEDEVVPSAKQDINAEIHNRQYSMSGGNLESTPDTNVIMKKGKFEFKRGAIPPLQAEALMRTRSEMSSTGSEPRSGVDLSWFDEISMDSKHNVSRQTSYTSEVKVYVDDGTSKRTLDSDADSVEGMIDEMARPHLHLQVSDGPTRQSEADSDASFSMTPISPLSPDTFDIKTGTYTLTYMSDDNLDAVSTDDNLDTECDIEAATEPDIEDTVEKGDIVGRNQKQKLKAANSLDLLVTKQGKFLHHDQDMVEIDSEFSEALKIADEHHNLKQKEADVAQSFMEEDQDDVDSSVQSDDFEVDIRTVPGRTAIVSKAKLAPQKSLDILISNQGDLIDPRIGSLELDTELGAVLEQQFQGLHLPDYTLDDVVKTAEKHIDYLGMQFNVDKGSVMDKSDPRDSKDSDQDDLDGTILVIPPNIVAQRMKLMQDNESSEESDILSVIEEEEELSETSEQTDEGKIAPQATPDLMSPMTIKEITQSVKETTVKSSEKNIKIADKVKLMEEKVKKITKVGKSPGHEKHEGYDVKVHSKFKKLQERWNAIERHEGDLLDLDDENGHSSNVSKVKEDKVEDSSSDKVPVIGSKSTKTEFRPMESNYMDVKQKANVDLDSNVNVTDESAIEEAVEKRTVVGRNEKQALSAANSLDLLIAKQGKFLESGDDFDKLVTEVEFAKKVVDKSTDRDRAEMNEEENFHNIIMQTAIDLNISTEIPDDSEESLSDTNEHFEVVDLITKSSAQYAHLRSAPGRRDTDIKRTYGKVGSSEFMEEHVVVDSYGDHKTKATDQDTIGDIPSVRHYVSRTDPIRLSMSDDDGRCHSLTDLQEEDILKLQDIDIHDSLARCQSSGDLLPDVAVFRADRKRHSEGNDDDNETTHKPLVRLSKLRQGRRISEPSRKTDIGDLDRSTTYVVKKTISTPSSKSEYDQVFLEPHTSDNSKISYPPEPQCFKVPRIPIKIESRLSSSSVPSSPDLSFELPLTPMDSPRSDKISAGHRASPQTISESSTSQDDSGLASGGSRGTTPEHKRTDSGYSQSSLQSATLSTVTDRSTEEEEDIEKIVANVKASNKRGNLLSVVSDSRESIASFYSDAGDIAYSNIPVTGEILFGLGYNYKTGMLEVHVKQCRDIAAVDTKRKRSDPYVKTYLLPDKTRSGKRKTKVKKHTLNPTFDELLKYSISKSELENRTLWVTVWHNDRFGRNDFLGEVTINFDYYKFDDPSPKWYPLQERLDTQPTSILTYKGDIVLSIRYVPADKVKVTEYKGKSPKKEVGPGKGQLHVVVKEARNLTAVRSNGFSDPFCKGYLLPERHRSSKQKTAVIKKNCSPSWNHMFIFEDVSILELQERCLELTIWDYEKLASNDFLGGVRLNLGTGMSQGRPVDWMDARGEEMTMWQAMLDRPNIWIDGTLILRPNMDKRKF